MDLLKQAKRAGLTRKHIELDCGWSKLKKLPPLLPTLITLYCEWNELTELPDDLPKDLETLWCFNNKLTSLPSLPLSLTELWCGDNLLTELPILPLNLVELYCAGNKIKRIDYFPKTLKLLVCDSDVIINFNNVPYGLNKINGTSIMSNKLNNHNKKRRALGFSQVQFFPIERQWDEINRQYEIYLYAPQGTKFKESEAEFYNLATN